MILATAKKSMSDLYPHIKTNPNLLGFVLNSDSKLMMQHLKNHKF